MNQFNFMSEISTNPIDYSPSVLRSSNDNIYETTDEIKENFDEMNRCLYYRTLPIKSHNIQKYYNIYQIYSEKTTFYDNNVKTSFLKSINQTVADNIIDGNTRYETLEGETTEFEPLTHFNLEDIITNVNIFGEAGLLLNVQDGEYSFDVIKPFRYIESDDKKGYKEIHIVYFKDYEEDSIIKETPILLKRRYTKHKDEYIIKDRYYKEKRIITSSEYTSKIKPFHRITGQRLFTDGALELSLVHSSVWTSLYKDVATGSSQLFLDEQYTTYKNYYNNKRISYVPVAETHKAIDSTTKPLFEHYAPTIRSTEHKEIIDGIEEQLASILNISKEVFSSSTATEATIIDSKTAKRFNKTKKLISTSINELLYEYGIKLIIEDYKNETKEFQIKNAVLLKSNNISTQLPLLKEIYSSQSDEWIEREYLKTEIKNGIYLTLDEQEKAIQYGLITGDDPPNDTSGQTDEKITTDKQIDNVGKVNIQGVPIPKEKGE